MSVQNWFPGDASAAVVSCVYLPQAVVAEARFPTVNFLLVTPIHFVKSSLKTNPALHHSA